MFKIRKYFSVKGERWMEYGTQGGIYRRPVFSPYGYGCKYKLREYDHHYDSYMSFEDFLKRLNEYEMGCKSFEERYLTTLPNYFETSKLQGKYYQKKRFKNRDKMKNKRRKLPMRLKIRKEKSIHSRNILHQLNGY